MSLRLQFFTGRLKILNKIRNHRVRHDDVSPFLLQQNALLYCVQQHKPHVPKVRSTFRTTELQSKRMSFFFPSKLHLQRTVTRNSYNSTKTRIYCTGIYAIASYCCIQQVEHSGKSFSFFVKPFIRIENRSHRTFEE